MLRHCGSDFVRIFNVVKLSKAKIKSAAFQLWQSDSVRAYTCLSLGRLTSPSPFAFWPSRRGRASGLVWWFAWYLVCVCTYELVHQALVSKTMLVKVIKCKPFRGTSESIKIQAQCINEVITLTKHKKIVWDHSKDKCMNKNKMNRMKWGRVELIGILLLRKIATEMNEAH